MFAYLIEYNRYLNILGIILIFAICFMCSRNRSAIKLRYIINAFLVQIVLAFFMLKTSLGRTIIESISSVVARLYFYAEDGSRFLFGSLAVAQEPWGFVFAFRVLPVLIFFGALMALLFHFRIIQKVAQPITRLLYPLFGTSAAETLCAVSNSVLGQAEAPLLIKAYLPKLTKSELLTIMVAGMGTISAPLFAVYAAIGVPLVYILTSSIMAIPSTILISKILLPETQTPQTQHRLHEVDGINTQTFFDALSDGIFSGLQLALAVGAVLIAFVSLISVGNGVLGFVSWLMQKITVGFGFAVVIPVLTIQGILGALFAPIGWLLGLSGQEILRAGELIGMKLALNELIAFAEMIKMTLSDRAVALLTFVLCGFANFSSIGIQIAGIGALAPNVRTRLAELGMLAVLGGTLSTILSAFIAGLLL